MDIDCDNTSEVFLSLCSNFALSRHIIEPVKFLAENLRFRGTRWTFALVSKSKLRRCLYNTIVGYCFRYCIEQKLVAFTEPDSKYQYSVSM